MPSYPGAVKTFTTKNAGDVLQPADVNDLQDEVNAIEAGLLNGTATLNSSNSTLVHLSVTAGMNIVGNSTLGSTVTLGAQTYVFPSSGGSTGQILTCVSTSGSTMSLEWRANTVGATSLLKANSGSDSNAGAATVDSVAITGLTANDRLEVNVTVTGVANTVAAGVQLYHVTDASTICIIGAAAITAGVTLGAQALISQTAVNSTSIHSLVTGMLTNGTVSSTSVVASSIATAWTGNWTLGLRHLGVTAGGSAKWSWQVLKKAGQ